MLTDQELIDGLRSELGSIHPPADLTHRLRRQAAATHHRDLPRRRGQRRGRQRRIRVPAGSLAVIASAVVAIAVAAGALLLAGHRDQKLTSTTSPGHPVTRQWVPTLGQLEANFAILRRTQTAADRSAQTFCPHPCKEQSVPRLTRLARTLPDGTKIFLSVWRLKVPDLGQPAGSYALHEDLTYPSSRAIISVESLADVRFETGGGFAVLPSATIFGHQRAPLWTAIVPDGVARVRWTFACSGRGCRPAQRTPITVAVPVIGNTAAARVPGTGTVTSGPPRDRARAQWYASDGHQLASFTSTATGMPTQRTPPFFSTDGTTPDTQHDVTAHVIGRNPGEWYTRLELDRGSGAGIRLNDTVIGDGALVGTIIKVTPTTSIVKLITDPSYAVAAKVLDRAGDTGMVVPRIGDPKMLVLKNVPRHPRPIVGETVVTTGIKSSRLSSTDATGIPIGQVTHSDPNVPNHDGIPVSPTADLRHLTTVQILTTHQSR